MLNDPKKNDKEYLKKRVEYLSELSDKVRDEMAKKARETKEEFESGVEEEMKNKYYG